jgi:hypothetical protein
MESTCKKGNCWFYLLMKELLGKELDFKDCPFYQEMIWTPDPVGEKPSSAVTIQDCVNKRSLLFQLEQVYPRLMGVQQSNEQMRNASYSASTQVAEALQMLVARKVDGFNKLLSEGEE